MAFYSAPEIAHVRVDVCDSCHPYLKTIDLTKTGLAVPVVDELARYPWICGRANTATRNFKSTCWEPSQKILEDSSARRIPPPRYVSLR